MDDKLSAVLRRLFIKFVLSQVVMLVVLVVLSVVFTAYYKGKLAEQLSSAVRFPILSGDTRQVMYDMSDSVTKNFSSMHWRPVSGQGAFSIPNGTGDINRFLYSFSSISICYDETERVAAGSLDFYYNRWPLIVIACIVWALAFTVSWFLIGAERRRVVREYNTAIELQVKESHIVLAAQVAHDIRSPLVALDAALKNTAELPEKKRIIVRHAVNRIRDIANNLLEKNRLQAGTAPAVAASAGVPVAGEPPTVHLLSSLIDPVITEKRLSFESKPGINIDFKLTPESYGLFASLAPVEFRRMLSNLVNNAVEALGDKGAVDVHLAHEDKTIVLTVSDDGKGIPPEILAKLGRRGETHGKAGGSGLGLFHARTTAESWGGSLAITSAPGKGTTVTIKLPSAAAPSYFVLELKLTLGRPILVLDDDPGVHHVWEGRFESARIKEHDIEVFHFSEPEQLRAWVKANQKKAAQAICLFDYELSGFKETGLSLAEELALSKQTILVSSRSEEPRILAGCARLGVRIIPKGLAGLAPISISSTAPAPQIAAPAAAGIPGTPPARAVLLDDSNIIQMTWEMAAQEHGAELLGYTDPARFLADLGTFPKDMSIYIDSELGDNIKGENLAADLKEKGFTNLCLATAHPPERFAHLAWLRVISKTPPWLQDAEDEPGE
jgi:signal transduction histidine kinase